MQIALHARAFVAFSLLLAAALLRHREIDADRQAVRWLCSPVALRHILDPATTLTRPKAARWRLSPLARHPSITEVVYRRELRPVITTGAEIMDEVFGSS